jgi:hypothetical protein
MAKPFSPPPITLTLANTQYSFTFPPGTIAWSMKAGSSHAVRWSFTSGRVAGPTGGYMTMDAGDAYNSPEQGQADGQTLYLASANAGTVVNIVVWS